MTSMGSNRCSLCKIESWGLSAGAVRLALLVAAICAIVALPLVTADAKTMVHPTWRFEIWYPDDWGSRCPEASDPKAPESSCIASTEHFTRLTEASPHGGDDAGEVWIAVGVTPADSSSGCEEILAAYPTEHATWQEKVIGGRKVLAVRTFGEGYLDFPPHFSEGVCFKEREKLVHIGIAGYIEPTPKFREYLAVFERAVASFRWLDPTPGAHGGSSRSTPQLPVRTPAAR